MNYVINLFNLNNNNAILIIICKLLKKKHYISCFTNDEEITAKKTVKLLL